MDLSLDRAELAFRDEIRSFIADNLTEDLRLAQVLTPSVFPDPDISTAWQKILHRRGWAAAAWPKQFGGTGWSLAQRYIFESEMAAAGAPLLHPLGLRMVGPVIMKFGTDAQRAFYLPRILAAEDYWCQGYSEPGAGSDLASLKTRAVRDGDAYVITGSKIWTTHAQHANRMFGLFRTSETGRKQDGISFIVLDMDTSGITVRPIITIGGDHEVNEVFFDQVRVPVANIIGEEGQGWSYGKYLLEFERGGAMVSGRLKGVVASVHRLARATFGENFCETRSDIARRLASIQIDIDALEMIELRSMSLLNSGQNPGSFTSSMLKLKSTELQQSITSLAIEVLGVSGTVWEPRRPLYDLPQSEFRSNNALVALPRYLDSRAYTIFGGASEIQRDILARVIIGS